MAGGLVGLFDDIAALAKLAAASIDDVGVAAGRASAKAAGVVIDDAAVTPAYVQGLAADRELPIIKRIAFGSIRNKLLFILPVVLVLNQFFPQVVNIILMCGGAFLCYEGAHKIIHKLKGDDHDHDVPSAAQGPEAEEKTIAGAIRTDFILSAEIMVISLKAIEGDPSWQFVAAIMVVIAILITVVVYGAVALIVKMDDIGLALARRDDEASQRTGKMLVAAMPKVLTFLTVVGTAAMLWVGGHIILAGLKDLHVWDSPYNFVTKDVRGVFKDIPGVGGLFAWLADTALSAILGLAVGAVIVKVVETLPFMKKDDHDAHADHSHAAEVADEHEA